MADASESLVRARELAAAGRAGQARTILLRALQKDPANAELSLTLGEILAKAGESTQARYYAENALSRRPDDAAVLAGAANVLAWAGAGDEGIAAFRRALALRPEMLDAWIGLCGLLVLCERAGELLDAAQRGLERFPDEPRLVFFLSQALRRTGEPERAMEALRRAAAVHPAHDSLALELAFTGNYADGVSRAESFAAHRRLGALLERRHGPPLQPPPPQDPSRRLQIGLLSPDLRRHSVGWFALPLVEHLNRDEFDVTAYYSHPAEDDATKRFRALIPRWRDVASMSDEEALRTIVGDRIDILIDLAGLTSGHRPALLVRKPAPLIVTYLGYPNTLGLGAVGYRFVDSLTDPPESSDPWAVERLIRLDPCFLCYAPPHDAPEPSTARIDRGAAPVFGSFNAMAKYSDAALSLWARVLQAVPGSRLILKNIDLGTPFVASRTRDRLAAMGVAPERIEMLGFEKEQRSHLSAYDMIDIALDTLPYHGTTTTCESLLMGVPVVTLVGDRHASRVGLSLFSAVGLPQLAVRSPDEFVRIASSLVSDRAALASLRKSLRARLLSSPLCDAASHAGRFGAELRGIWRAACRAPSR